MKLSRKTYMVVASVALLFYFLKVMACNKTKQEQKQTVATFQIKNGLPVITERGYIKYQLVVLKRTTVQYDALVTETIQYLDGKPWSVEIEKEGSLSSFYMHIDRLGKYKIVVRSQ